MHRRKLMTAVFLAALVASLCAVPPQVRAQVCGDSNNDGDVTEADGVNTLRAAAKVSSPCSNATCDTNGDGVINDVDGVNVLRAAAGESASLNCVSAEINEVVSELETGGGAPPQLQVGAAPIPGGSAVDTVEKVEGNGTAVAGSSNTVKVEYDATEQAEAAIAAGTDPQHLDLNMIIAINDTERFLQGYFSIPLTSLTGVVSLTTFYPDDLEGDPFLFCPATQLNGVLSNYGALEQTPEGGQGGPLQVALSFTPSTVDVDLALVEPAPGERINFLNPTSGVTGGMLDMDSRCPPNDDGNENITYPAPAEPLAGQHVAEINYFSTCDNPSSVEYTVVINTNGSKRTVSGSFQADQTGANFTRKIPFNFTPAP